MPWKRLRAPAVLIGIGFGGFFDGIVFHQILQTHHMLSNAESSRIDVSGADTSTVGGLELNTLWDGVFHAFSYTCLAVGVLWLWRRVAPHRDSDFPSLGWLLSSMITGWGAFNVVEGLLNHHVLEIHHVVEGDHQTLADVAFLAVGSVMIVGGMWQRRRFET